MARKFIRRNYFIDKGAQTRFIAGFAGVSILGGIVAVLCFWYLSYRKIDAMLYSMRLPEENMGALFAGEMLLTIAVSVVLVLALFIYTASKAVARMEGPLRKMAGAVRMVAGGDLKSGVKLRENDEFQDFAREMDATVHHLNQKFTAIRDTSSEVLALCQSRKDVGRLRDRLDALRQELQVVKT